MVCKNVQDILLFQSDFCNKNDESVIHQYGCKFTGIPWKAVSVCFKLKGVGWEAWKKNELLCL